MKNLIFKMASIAAVILTIGGCGDDTAPTAKPVKLGVPDQPSSALIHIALANGYFKDAGLDVTTVHFASGKRALLDGYVPGKIDYFTTADVPFVNQAFVDPDIVALASIYTADNVNRIVARRDHGVNDFADLAGKTIATQKSSAVHYFLHSVLNDKGVDHEQVTLKFFAGKDLPNQLIKGSIDAFSMREPFVSEAVAGLGDKAVVLAAPGIYVQSELLVTKRGTLEADPEIAGRLLTALARAEDFALGQKAQAIAVVAKALKVDDAKIAAIWDTLNFELSMNQSLLPQFERLGAWVTDEINPGVKAPSFLNHLEAAPLKAVRPENVSLVQ